MRKGLIFLCLLAAVNVWADAYQDAGSVSATQTNTAVTFTDDTGSNAFSAASVWLKNDDATNEAYICFSGTVAAASAGCGFELKAGESITVNFPSDEGQTGIGVICASGETATVRYLAIR